MARVWYVSNQIQQFFFKNQNKASKKQYILNMFENTTSNSNILPVNDCQLYEDKLLTRDKEAHIDTNTDKEIHEH